MTLYRLSAKLIPVIGAKSENRELGESPKRTHHCMIERLQMPLEFWEGAIGDEIEPGDLPVIDIMSDGKVHYLLTTFFEVRKTSNGLFLFSNFVYRPIHI